MNIEVFDFEQGSPDWFAARLGIVTASELSKVLAKGEGKTRKKYMLQLAAETLTRRPTESYTNGHMERGKEQEEMARELIELRLGKAIATTGFIKNHTLRIGCSPDGLIGPDHGLEIKCCLGDIQLDRLDNGSIPSEHRAQVEGSLLASGFKSWTFCSYSPDLPLLMVTHTLSDERKKEIEAELSAFNAELDARVNKYKGMY